MVKEAEVVFLKRDFIGFDYNCKDFDLKLTEREKKKKSKEQSRDLVKSEY